MIPPGFARNPWAIGDVILTSLGIAIILSTASVTPQTTEVGA